MFLWLRAFPAEKKVRRITSFTDSDSVIGSSDKSIIPSCHICIRETRIEHVLWGSQESRDKWITIIRMSFTILFNQFCKTLLCVWSIKFSSIVGCESERHSSSLRDVYKNKVVSLIKVVRPRASVASVTDAKFSRAMNNIKDW